MKSCLLKLSGSSTGRERSASAVPLERMMVETDAPYLTPVPFRGKRNDSGYVHLVAEKIAQLKGLPAEQVERRTWENGVRFFGIPQE